MADFIDFVVISVKRRKGKCLEFQMETFATSNQNHTGATAGQNFSAPGGEFLDISQLSLLAGHQLCKGTSHPLCFRPSL